MKEQNFLVYETPKVELIEVQVEQGFATSGGIDDVGSGGAF